MPATTFNEEIAETICTRVANGETLTQVCRDPSMAPKRTFLDWVARDKNGLSERYARARDRQIEHWADELLLISDDGSNDWMVSNRADDGGWRLNGEHVQRSRLRADSRKWLLSKLRPDKYGEKVAHQHGSDPKAPMITETRVGATDARIIAILCKSGMSEEEARAAIAEQG